VEERKKRVKTDKKNKEFWGLKWVKWEIRS